MNLDDRSSDLNEAVQLINGAISLLNEKYKLRAIPKFIYRYEDILYKEIQSYILYKQGSYEPALNHLDLCTRRDPEHAWSYFRIGLILQEKGEHRQALVNYHRAQDLAIKHREGPLESLCENRIKRLEK